MRTRATLLTILGLGICVSWLTGCGGQEAPPDAAPKLAVAAPSPPASALPTLPLQSASGPHTPSELEARLHQSFADATIAYIPGEQWLPEVTKSGKSVGKLYESVLAEWPKVRFTAADCKKLVYEAVLTTDLGVVTIELWPEIAPNHVRNFIALARAGYFDGLEFDRAVKRERDDMKEGWFECVEAGCPLGTGDVYYGSIGYWLKPEFGTSARHDEGAVGACRGEEVETAACKFYINLSAAEWMDGNYTQFGKVAKGLDVVRAVHRRPVRDDEVRDRPVEPVVIRSVAIECRQQ